MTLETTLVQVRHAISEFYQFLLNGLADTSWCSFFPKPPIGGSVHKVNADRTVRTDRLELFPAVNFIPGFAFLLV